MFFLHTKLCFRSGSGCSSHAFKIAFSDSEKTWVGIAASVTSTSVLPKSVYADSSIIPTGLSEVLEFIGSRVHTETRK